MTETRVRRLFPENKSAVREELKRIGVDQRAYSIFADKADNLLLKFEGLSCPQANVLKQTALICGADAAIPKSAYKGGRGRRFALILFANRRELRKIRQRLCEQPWLDKITDKLDHVLKDDGTPVLKINRRLLKLERTYIMGIINLTPDSFYSGSSHTTKSVVEKVVTEMTSEGVDFIDIGAESTRPGSLPVNEREEMRRLNMVLPAVMKIATVPVSIDTYKAKVAALAIDHGVSIVNDISGLRFDKKMAPLIARKRAGVVIMHMKGKPKTMQRNPRYNDLMHEIHRFFKERIAYAVDSGIEPDRIIVDPGLGFGKRLEDNYTIINRLAEFKDLNRPVLVGHSRKSFVGKPFDLSPEHRLEGTLGIEALLIANGASILRVHDILESKRVAQLVDKIVR
ncbi:MAG: dihydropteroate synthase [candidate division WOR-3 bacterium]|nr:MAG: dihydropteroate synthase [candidate division WOR-3 bacterium]